MVIESMENEEKGGAVELPPADQAAVDAVIERYKSKKGALIPVLDEIRNIYGYIPDDMQHKVAAGLCIPLKEVRAVVTLIRRLDFWF